MEPPSQQAGSRSVSGVRVCVVCVVRDSSFSSGTLVVVRRTHRTTTAGEKERRASYAASSTKNKGKKGAIRRPPPMVPEPYIPDVRAIRPPHPIHHSSTIHPSILEDLPAFALPDAPGTALLHTRPMQTQFLPFSPSFAPPFLPSIVIPDFLFTSFPLSQPQPAELLHSRRILSPPQILVAMRQSLHA